MSESLEQCPLCDGTDWKKLPIPGHWIGQQIFDGLAGHLGLVRCRQCTLVFINPRPSPSQLNLFYSSDIYSCHETEGSASAGAKARYILQKIERYVPSNLERTLLDYGAGGGGFIAFANSAGWKTEGFEPGLRGLETCDRLGLNVSADPNQLQTNWAGIVTMHHVFEHLSNPIEVLASLRRYLTTQGRLYVEVPNERSLRSRLSLPILSRNGSVDERYRAFPIHLMYYNRSTLTGMLEKAGWRVEATFTLGLGFDEYFVQSSKANASNKSMQNASNSMRDKTVDRKRLRHRVRDAYLALGIGENLAVIAS